jgi:hypothetical protein
MQEEDTDNDTTTGKKNNYLAPVHPTLSELPENVRDTGAMSGFDGQSMAFFLPSIHVGLSSHETLSPVHCTHHPQPLRQLVVPFKSRTLHLPLQTLDRTVLLTTSIGETVISKVEKFSPYIRL